MQYCVSCLVHAGCIIDAEMPLRREGLPNTVKSLRQGSVLDVLCPQAKSVTVDTSAHASGTLYLLNCVICADVCLCYLTALFIHATNFT